VIAAVLALGACVHRQPPSGYLGWPGAGAYPERLSEVIHVNELMATLESVRATVVAA
jgi:hypothetical protein